MSISPTTTTIIDGSGNTKQVRAGQSSADQSLAFHHIIEVGGTEVSSSAPLPVTTNPYSMTITQTVVALSSTDAVIVAANAARKYLAIVNIGTGLATLNFGSAATAGQGFPLSAASTAGDQGGGLLFDGNMVTTQAVHGICASAVTTNVVVLEGV